MTEMALTASDLVVIGRGKLIADTTVADFIASNTEATVLVRSPQIEQLGGVLEGIGASLTKNGDDGLLVTKIDASRIGDAALGAGVAIHELSPQHASLEEVFMELTSDSVDYQGLTAQTGDAPS
jgi:ABC-2 type transport system ATP-binding protein